MMTDQQPQQPKNPEPPPMPMPSRQEPPPMPSSQVPPPSPLGEDLKEQFKTAANDSLSSLKGFWQNPETGVVNALGNIGPQKAMLTALFMIGSIAIANYLFIRMASTSQLSAFFTLGGSLRLLVQLALPSIALAITFSLTSIALKSGCGYKECSFAAAMVSIPLVLPGFGLVFVGAANPMIYAALIFATLCFMALLTYFTCRHVLGFGQKMSFLLTPSLLLASAYLTIVFTRMWMDESGRALFPSLYAL
jgi:hypothetical protein